MYQTHATTMASSPSTPAAWTSHLGARSSPRDIQTPSAAPTPSSQVRVSVEKYAVVGDSYVAYTDHANDAALSAPISTSGVRRPSRPPRSAANAIAATSSNGHTR